MTPSQSLRRVVIAPDSLDPANADDHEIGQAERSRLLRICPPENGYNVVAVLCTDTFLHERVAQRRSRCPPKGGPLSQGVVFGTSVACPLHIWTIALEDGCSRCPDEGCVPKFASRVEAGKVPMDPVELATLALGAPA